MAEGLSVLAARPSSIGVGCGKECEATGRPPTSVVFNRVPKCGSTSLEHIIRRQAGRRAFHFVRSDDYANNSLGPAAQFQFASTVADLGAKCVAWWRLVAPCPRPPPTLSPERQNDLAPFLPSQWAGRIRSPRALRRLSSIRPTASRLHQHRARSALDAAERLLLLARVRLPNAPAVLPPRRRPFLASGKLDATQPRLRHDTRSNLPARAASAESGHHHALVLWPAARV